VHPMSAHESATQAAGALWRDRPDDAPKPMAMEQILPFGAGHDFFDRMGGRVYPNGHSMLGTNFSIHSGYAQVPEYEAALRAAHGDGAPAKSCSARRRTRCVFRACRQGLAAGHPRDPPAGGRSHAAGAWSFRVEGAPDLLFERSMTYNRLVFSPMSVVAHDDVHLFESIQQGLRAGTNEWVSLHRDFDRSELGGGVREVNGTNELLMRNQFRAWPPS